MYLQLQSIIIKGGQISGNPRVKGGNLMNFMDFFKDLHFAVETNHVLTVKLKLS